MTNASLIRVAFLVLAVASVSAGYMAAGTRADAGSPTVSPTATPVLITGLHFTALDAVAWDDPKLGQSAMRVTGRGLFVPRSCELQASVASERVEFDDLLPGNAISYKIPGSRDASVLAVGNLTVKVEALGQEGAVVAAIGVAVTADLPYDCPTPTPQPSALPRTGGAPGGGDGGAGLALIAGFGALLALGAVAIRLGLARLER